jgi:hypothetical protein
MYTKHKIASPVSTTTQLNQLNTHSPMVAFGRKKNIDKKCKESIIAIDRKENNS